MKSKIHLLTCFLISLGGYAQSFQWIKDGGSSENLGSNDFEQVYSIATDSQKNVYVLSKVGMSSLDVDGNPKTNYDNPSFTPTDTVLASFSCDGTYRWSKVIGGSDDEEITAVQLDSEDNVYVAGRIATCNDGSSLQPFPGRIEDDYVFTNASGACSLIFLAKFDTNGVFQYVKRPQLPTSLSNAATYTRSYNFQIQNDSLYWFVWLPPGVYAEGGFTNNTTETHAPYVLKYNLDGTFIEATQLGTVQGLFSVVINYYRNPYNGFYYMTFHKVSATTFNINGQPIANTAALVCYDNNGNYLWKRENTQPMAGSLVFYSLDFDPQNNIYIGGKIASSSIDSFMGFTASFSAPAFVMKLDADASNLLWASHHDTVGSGGYGALIYNGDEVAYTGWCAGSNFTWGEQSIQVSNPNEGQDALLARFDSATGACLSLHNIPSTIGSTDRGTAIAVDASGDYLVGGGFAAQIFDTNGAAVSNEGGTTDFFIAKFATEICSVLSNENFEEATIQVYPNPASDFVTVSVKENTSYELYTLTGQIVKQGHLTAVNNTLVIQDLSSGCYLLQLKNEKGVLENIKVMKVSPKS
uniref:T9SS type A sorting domain-containing protein n=1 Tax=Flavobacterium sp. TaxID=239 RepID=UPI004048F998